MLATETTGAEVELCRDRAMMTGCVPTLSATGDQVRPEAALAPGVWFWRLRARSGARVGSDTSPTWQFWVGHRSADGDVDTSWGTTLDVNGDGFPDLAVGAPSPYTTAGTASVFLGSAEGLSAAPVVLEGVAGNDRFGWSVASAGDVDGDGFADLVVGAQDAAGGAGTASIFYGSAEGLSLTPEVLTGDGGRFGQSVASAGDVDGDGFADLIVGAPSSSTVSIIYGRQRGEPFRQAVLEGVTAEDRFGWSVASAGDVDGDGFADLVVGASHASPGGRTRAGTASIFYGRRRGVPLRGAVLEGVGANDEFGSSVASAGDVDGDGFADLVVGAPTASPGGRRSAGAASIFYGSPDGLSAAHTFEGGAANDEFGFSVASAGDVDGDGFADTVVGAWHSSPGGRTRAGTASIFYGSRRETPFRRGPVLEGVAADDRFGTSVASAGDVDGDGFADLVVGAPTASPGGRGQAGTVSVFFRRSVEGPATTPALVLEGVAAIDWFGRSVASL